MNQDSGYLSTGTVLLEVAVIVPILVVAGVLMLQLGQIGAATPGEFTVVDIEPGNATVDELESVTVSATVKNTGEMTDTQYVGVTLGQAETERSLTLEPEASETIWLRGVAAKSLGVGDTTYRVLTADDAVSATLTVDSQRPPKFDVSDLDPEAVTLRDDGTGITVSARIENVGGESDAGMVEFRVGGRTYYQEPVTLDPGESDRFVVANLDLRWLGPGTHTYAISTATDTVRGLLTIPEPATFEFRDADAGSGTVHVDDPITVSVTVANTGDVAGDGTVDLVVGSEVLRTETVALESGATTRVAFEDLEPGRLAIGLHQYHLRVGDAIESGTLVVEGDEPAAFEVTSLEPRSITVEDGGSFDIAATIENTGEQTANRTVEFTLRGVTRYEETIELPPGERTEFDVHNLSLEGISPGEYEYAVRTGSDVQTGHVLILSGPDDVKTAMASSDGGGRDADDAEESESDGSEDSDGEEKGEDEVGGEDGEDEKEHREDEDEERDDEDGDDEEGDEKEDKDEDKEDKKDEKEKKDDRGKEKGDDKGKDKDDDEEEDDDEDEGDDEDDDDDEEEDDDDDEEDEEEDDEDDDDDEE